MSAPRRLLPPLHSVFLSSGSTRPILKPNLQSQPVATANGAKPPWLISNVRQKYEHAIYPMKKMSFSEAVSRSQKIRKIYHRLELKHHGSEWTTEEDALAFLTDAGLVGRLTMAHQGRWPTEKGDVHDLAHKLGECIWWVIVLAERLEIDAESALESFLTKTEQQLKGSHAPTSPQRKARRAISNAVLAPLPPKQ